MGQNSVKISSHPYDRKNLSRYVSRVVNNVQLNNFLTVGRNSLLSREIFIFHQSFFILLGTKVRSIETQVFQRVVNCESSWQNASLETLSRNFAFCRGTRKRTVSIPDVPRILRSSLSLSLSLSLLRIVRDCHERGLGFTGEMLDLLDRDTRGRAWTWPPCPPLWPYR